MNDRRWVSAVVVALLMSNVCWAADKKPADKKAPAPMPAPSVAVPAPAAPAMPDNRVNVQIDFKPIEQAMRSDKYLMTDILRMLAQRRVMQQKPKEALAFFDLAMTVNPQDPMLLQEKARAQHQSGDMAGALKTWKTALAERNDDMGLVSGYAAFLEEIGQKDEAIAMMRKYAAAHPEQAYLKYWVVDAYQRQQKPAEAQAELDAILKADPTQADEVTRRKDMIAQQEAMAKKMQEMMKPPVPPTPNP